MDSLFAHDYDLDSLVKIRTRGFDFDFYITPRFYSHYEENVFEKCSAQLIRQNATGVATFIDIGANYGFFDVLVGINNPGCKIMAFEPVPENCEVLRKNLDLHDIKATIYPVAVSDRSGHGTLQVSVASDNSGLVANPAVGIIRQLPVDVVKLDKYRAELADGPVLIKMDTEGHESKILDGMHQIIEKIDDLRLLIEFNPMCLAANGSSPEALLAKIIGLGFDVFFVHDEEQRFERFQPGSDWREFLAEEKYKNLFCVRKARSANLLVFSHSAERAGAERSLLEFAGGIIAKYGSLCTVVLPSQGPLVDMLHSRGAATLVLNYSWWCTENPSATNGFADLMQASYRNVLAATATFRKLSPDVVITNTLVIPWGAVAAWKLNRPHFWWVHEFGPAFEFYYTFQQAVDIIGEASNEVVVNSPALRRTLFGHLSPEKCRVVTTGNISLSEARREYPSAFKYPKSTKLVICGRVSKNKGQDDAIHAVKNLAEAGHDIELCVVGDADPAFGSGLRELVELERLDNRVHFAGFVDNVREVLEAAHISLTCSRSESFSRTTIEAMLLGKPVIGTKAGGTVDLIEDGVDGFLYVPGNIEELVEKIAYFLKHPVKIKEFGRRARENITRKLAANPDDEQLYALCQSSKGIANPNSEKLRALILGWQEGIIDGLDRLLAEGQVAERRLLEEKRQTEQKLQAEKDETAQRLEAEKHELARRLSEEKQEAIEWLTAKKNEVEQRLMTAEQEARTRLAMVEAALGEKEREARHLAEESERAAKLLALVEAALGVKEREARHLVEENQQAATLLAVSEADRANMGNQIRGLRSFIQAKEQDLRIAASFIAELHRSLGWRMVLWLRSRLDALAPASSYRRRIYKLPFGIVRWFLHRGRRQPASSAGTPLPAAINSVGPSTDAALEIAPRRAVCTIASKNYLSHVRVFAHSVAKSNPGIEIYVLLVDRPENKFDPAEEPYHLIAIEELDNIPNPPHFFFKYDPIELNTAVKPFFLEHLFRKIGLQKLCYFDPDIYVFSDLQGIWDLLDMHGLVVTPHITTPYRDKRHPTELEINQAGVFNLGFLGVANNAETNRFLEWWKDRLYDYGYMKPSLGMHVDQSWVNFAPALQDNVFVTRDPSCNIAYWNLHERGARLRFTDYGLMIDHRPAMFFHFSGFDLKNIESISRHQDRFTLSDFGNLRPLFEFYRDALRDSGAERVQHWPYVFGRFDNGVRIPQVARSLYSALGKEEVARFGNPFGTAGTRTFFAWMNESEKGPSSQGHPTITRLHTEVHRQRADLQRAFPDPHGADRLPFWNWLREWAPNQFDMDAALLRDETATGVTRTRIALLAASARGRIRGFPHSLRSVVRDLLRRRLDPGGRWAKRLREWDRRLFGTPPATGPIQPVSTAHAHLPFGVNVAGYIQGEFGTAEGVRGTLSALAAVNIPHALNNVQAAYHRHEDRSFEGLAEENPHSINLVHVNADQVPLFAAQKGQGFFAGRYNIGYWFWELSQFPEKWRSSFDRFQEIWVGSQFCQESIAKASPIPVVKMTFPVLVNEADAVPSRRLFGLADNKFIYGFVFDYFSVVERKNPFGLIKAFRMAFGKDERTLLVIKSINAEYSAGQAAALREAAGDCNIRFIDGHMSRGDMIRFLASMDCFVSLHRSEGFGISMAQAMYLGKPVIATGYSGNMEFMNHNNSFLVPYELTELRHAYGPYEKGNVWADPDLEHAASLMRSVFENPGPASQVAQRAMTDIRTKMTPQVAGEEMKHRLLLVSSPQG